MVREMDFVDECYADKDLSLLKKLTLVIPTYNRNYYLSRCLWYHAHFPFGQIIVADSSPEEKKVVNRETVAKVREMFGADILYLEYEPETEKYGGDIYRKWIDSVLNTSTEYLLFCGDKEFYLPYELVCNINFLDVHQDYVSTVGGQYNLIEHHLPNNVEYKNYGLVENYVMRSSEEENNPLSRFVDSLNKHGDSNTLLFSIIRTEHQKKICERLILANIQDLLYLEIALSYTQYIYGKVKYFQNTHYKVRDTVVLHNLMIKSGNGNCNSSESSLSRHPYLLDDYQKITECVDFRKYYLTFIRSILQSQSIDIDDDVLSCIENTSRLKVNPNRLTIMLKWIWLKKIKFSRPWSIIPYRTKKIIQEFMNRLFGTTMDIGGETILNLPQSLQIDIITKIVRETSFNHSTDSPII